MLIDSTKVFDTIYYDILSKMLQSFERNNQSLLWFKSDIANRQQLIVKLNYVKIDINCINYGVPQGSVQSPI